MKKFYCGFAKRSNAVAAVAGLALLTVLTGCEPTFDTTTPEAWESSCAKVEAYTEKHFSGGNHREVLRILATLPEDAASREQLLNGKTPGEVLRSVRAQRKAAGQELPPPPAPAPGDDQVDAQVLYYAQNGDLLKLQQLISTKKPDLSKIIHRGNTALHMAANSDNPAVAAYLVAQGVDINADSPVGSALYVAVCNDNAAMVDTLLALGADVNQVNFYGFSPLHASILFCNDTSIIGKLLAAKADINQQTVSGNTALHLAMAANDPKMVDFLLKAGAKKDIVNKHGQLAADRGFNEECKQLINQ